MKKILSLCLALSAVFATEADAQWRKTWDFTKGLSAETQQNLIADEANWSITYQDDGVSVKEAKDLTKMSGELMANGKPIEELRGLTFGSAGLSKNNNYIVASSKFRMTRNNMELNLPKLASGQKITIRARSANSTADNRGFYAGNDNIEYIEGPVDGICLGGSIADPSRDEDGNYTLVWQVKDGFADSVDVQIKLKTGGLDIALIQIDGGDNEVTHTDVAYIYDSGYPDYSFGEEGYYEPNYDILVNTLPSRIEDLNLVAIDVADGGAAISADSLQHYSTVVVSSAIRNDNAFVNTLKSAIGFVPMLNLSPDLYETWGYGKAVTTETNMLTVADNWKSIFSPYNQSDEPYIDENGQLIFWEDGTVTGVELTPGTYFANDDTLAMAGNSVAVHIHNPNRNAYMMIPYTFPFGGPGASFMDITPNAVVALCNTKANVVAAAKPTAIQEYHHNYTTVTLQCLTANAKMYYTTDGSTPTTESTPYTEPFNITQDGQTVKAVAIADGFLLSDVSETAIEIHQLADQPTISVTEESGKSTITITPAYEGDVVYYNFTGSDEKAKSAEYTEPITVTKHTTVTAFTDGVEGSYLQSETVQKFVAVQDEKVRMDIVSHMDANATDYNIFTSNKYYTRGYNFYTDEIIDEEVYEDYFGPGQDSIVYIYAPANQLTCINPGKGWEIKSYGQPMLYQSIDAGHDVLDFNAYNPQTPWDDSEQEITKGCITLASVNYSDGNGFKDPASACIQSTEAFQGPFDVVTYLSGKNCNVEVYVTNDTISGEWTKIGDLLSNDISGVDDDNDDGSSRIWKKTILPYDGTEKMFVKVASADGPNANIFDIFIKNEGEASKDYITGIKDVTEGSEAAGEVVKTLIYSINGTQLNEPAKGINIIKEVYANGQVKTRKAIVK